MNTDRSASLYGTYVAIDTAMATEQNRFSSNTRSTHMLFLFITGPLRFALMGKDALPPI